MSVEEELKRKRAELLGKVEELTLRIEAIKKQISAIDQVIAIYDPARTAPPATTAAPKRSRQAIPLPITLGKLNKTAAILEVLREAAEPLSSLGVFERGGVVPLDQRHDVEPPEAADLFQNEVLEAPLPPCCTDERVGDRSWIA